MNEDTVTAVPTKDTGFWTEPRVALYVVISPYLGARDVRIEQLRQMIDALRGNDRELSRRQKLRLALVLEELCKGGVLDSAVLPEVPTRVPRPQVLPGSHESFRLLSSFQLIRDYLWNDWLAQQRTSADLYLAFTLVLGIEMGLAGTMWHRLLSLLQWKDVRPNGSVAFRIHWRDKSDRRHFVRLSASTILLLEKIRDLAASRESDDHVFFPLARGIKRRADALERSLASTYRHLKKQLEQRYPDHKFPTWAQLPQGASTVALFEGIQHPCLLTASKQATLATSVPLRARFPVLVGEDGPPACFIRHVATEKIERIRVPRSWKAVPVKAIESDEDLGNNDWCGKALQLQRQLLAEIQSQFSKRVTANRAEQLRPLFARYRIRASQLACPTSALHLALDWAEHKFLTLRKVKPSSLAKYLRIAFEEGFLDDPRSNDLSTWQREDHEQLIARLLEIRRAPATTKQMLIILQQVYEFASGRGYCNEPPNVPYSLQWVGGSGRPVIVGLGQFDAFIGVLGDERSRENRMLAVAAILGFDAGLRADEVVTLTLGDIMVADDELWVWVWQGKSLAARRAIPLHLLAPRSHVAAVADWVRDRRAEFRDDANIRTIGLFGPEGDRDRYDYESLIGNLIDSLKDSFGEGLDFHSLRHAFASMLFLRWYATRHEDFAQMLYEGDHELFQSPAMVRLARFFTVGRYDRVPHYSPSDLVMMAKLMGHNGLETYFASYVHTFHAVQHHVVVRLDRLHGARKLPGQTIALLMPNMRNRKTQAKLPERTIAYLARLRVPSAFR